MSQTETTIRQVLAKIGQAPVPAGADASLYEAGVIDSFGVMDLVSDLEKAFSIQVSDSEMVPSRFETIARIVMFVEAKLG
jgi:acyl carrier protein